MSNTNIQNVGEKQDPAREMEKSHPEWWKENSESGVMDLKTGENVKKKDIIKNFEYLRAMTI